jgi:hypothetical protein
MIKNKRIKKNWSEEDVQILVWVTSKYADSKRYEDIEKELVSITPLRIMRTGKSSHLLFQESLLSRACSNGSA